MRPVSKIETRQKIIKILSSKKEKELLNLSKKIINNLLSLKDFLEKSIYFVYVSQEKEVFTHDLIKFLLKKGKIVLVPKIVDKNIIPVEIKNFDNLKIGRYGILEPILENAFEGKIDISVVPGLAFTKEGTRLGRGGGFYDRFFAKNKNGFKIGLCYDFQLID
ncbi:MAG: 5-formyltetrahydrofolate cyclo-ligase, partial [Candidatus Gracilibacteria bacterium]|nr:5-formyltetrahydrofolate cyclo-ligase [Candidatus Gracilibacteria bacterium]